MELELQKEITFTFDIWDDIITRLKPDDFARLWIDMADYVDPETFEEFVVVHHKDRIMKILKKNEII